MEQSIPCQIERLSYLSETAWMISIPANAVPNAALLLSALLYKKANRVKFADKFYTVSICNTSGGYSLNLNDQQIAVTADWIEAVLGILLDVCLSGWSNTAHLDQDFENVCVTVAVLPPNS